MSISEAQRYEIYESMKSQHGESVANNVMSLLPPVGWADVATKHDVAAGFESLRRDVARLDRTQHAIIGWLIVSQATLFTAICAATALILTSR